MSTGRCFVYRDRRSVVGGFFDSLFDFFSFFLEHVLDARRGILRLVQCVSGNFTRWSADARETGSIGRR